MEKPAETTTPKDEKHSVNLGFIVWPLVILILYLLSFGPFWMMIEKGLIGPLMITNRRVIPNNKFIFKFYQPVFWAYDNTLFHKPLGIYLHLWVPKLIDNNGEYRLPRS
jgi:hypothetical protein